LDEVEAQALLFGVLMKYSMKCTCDALRYTRVSAMAASALMPKDAQRRPSKPTCPLAAALRSFVAEVEEFTRRILPYLPLECRAQYAPLLIDITRPATSSFAEKSCVNYNKARPGRAASRHRSNGGGN